MIGAGGTFADSNMTFDDLGAPAGRVPTEEVAARREAADAEAIWNTTCPRCQKALTGSRELLLTHMCGDPAALVADLKSLVGPPTGETPGTDDRLRKALLDRNWS